MNLDKALNLIIDKFINNKKEVFKNALQELGFTVDLDHEAKKAFPNVKIVHHCDGREVWMYNNGTTEGLEVVTFYRGNLDSPLVRTDANTVAVEMNYYINTIKDS